MMWRKAILFAPDSEYPGLIKEETDPKTIKALGRRIPDFDEDTWVDNRYKIVVDGNYLKFTQDENLKQQLLSTGERDLVEASPMDKIWGVGYGKKNAWSM